ncbi:MAG: type IV pilin protein [Pseudobdellovibrionaceae bacterium]
MKKGTFNSQSGFSLVELMVVVAIIGVLAAMSAGQVQKQIAKARQSEAKTNLGTLWTSMEAFRAEWNSYTTDFGANKLSYNGKFYYHVGFAANHRAVAGITGYQGSQNTQFNTTGAAVCPPLTCVPLSGATVPAGTSSATASTFLARASGQPMAGTPDVWDIGEGKILTNSTIGVQ